MDKLFSEDVIITFFQVSCLFNFILIFALIGVARSRERLQIELRNFKRKVQKVKEDVKKW